jgi:RNA polymerase sigma factor for flagellar operon FliA
MSAVAASRAAPPSREAALIEKHTDLVKRIAYHLAARLPASVEVNDLIQAGIIGLIEAARHYTEDRGASFETYASIRIRGAMVDELRRSDWAPRSVHRRAREAADAIHKLEQTSGHAAKDADIASAMGVSLPEYHQISADAARCQVMSMSARTDDDEAMDAPDESAGPLDRLQRDEFQKLLAQSIDGLPEREKMVLSLYYNDEMNLREIGATLGISESRVCQIHGQALLRLRTRMGDWREEAASQG